MRSFLPLFACCLLSSCWWSIDPNTTAIGDGPTLPPKPIPPPLSTEVPHALPVPGREGYVFSPFHNKVVDCKGFARGTLVFDPYDTEKPRRKFRVP